MLTIDKKKEIVKRIAHESENNRLIGLLEMKGLPAKQLQKIKKSLGKDVRIIMTRKKLIRLALKSVNKDNLENLSENKVVQPALIFCNEDPFELYKKLKRERTSAPARTGATVTKDVTIPPGPTDIGPGPMIGHLQALGIKVKVEGGKLTIQNEKVVIKAGETLTKEISEVLNQLGIEPLEIGLDLVLAYDDGNIFTKEIMDIDVQEYIDRIIKSASSAFKLAMYIRYISAFTIVPLLQKAFLHARNLGIAAEIPEKEIIAEIISNAVRKAKILEEEIKREG